MSAIALKDVPALSHLIHVALKQQVSVPEIVWRIQAAGESLYHVKSFSICEHDIPALALQTGGPHLDKAMNIGIGLPAISTTYQKMDCPQIQLSIYGPNVLDVTTNISSAFCSIHTGAETAGQARNISQTKCLWSLLIDEVAIEHHPQYDYDSDSVAGICQDHSGKIDLMGITAHGLEAIRAIQIALESGQCHHAKEATVIAIAGFGQQPYTYGAWVVAVSGTCKTESEEDGYKALMETHYAAEFFTDTA
ncbi:hypothetical protein FRC11_009275 [Ceratobasidium sp. 423]|nr:hypothetical protein FRC11_009275 [Ceratobasidium sp. 423]